MAGTGAKLRRNAGLIGLLYFSRGPEEVTLFDVKALGYLSLGWDVIAVGVFSPAVLYCAVARAQPGEEADVHHERIKGIAIMFEKSGEA
ncbi:MAG: hypothetical protein ACRES7_03075 [Gammaproteobacteria bacterium]